MEIKNNFFEAVKYRWGKLPLELRVESIESIAGVDDSDFHPVKNEPIENQSTEVDGEQPEH